MRLIDADKLMETIDALSIDPENDGSDGGTIIICNRMFQRDDIEEIIDDQPTVEPKECIVAKIQFDEERMQEICREAVQSLTWTPCSEGLPDEHHDVLVTSFAKYGGVGIGQYDHVFGWTKNGYSANVVAWMPLPKPYEEDDDAD